MRERLQKILARAGHGSRRSAERLIAEGRVRVNGDVVRELGAQADAASDAIEVDGAPIALPEEAVYIAMNKPAGYLTTARDPQRRRTVMALLPGDLAGHVYPVGRLDRDTEGLLLFTGDGELAHRLAHPRYDVEKEYHALVEGTPGPAALRRLREGVDIGDERLTAPATAEPARAPHGYDTPDGHTWLRLVLHEGRKRQVRRMCAAVGHPVRTLVRTRVGRVTLGRMARGHTRPLSKREIADLRAALRLPADDAEEREPSRGSADRRR